jgi:hypothetical protein
MPSQRRLPHIYPDNTWLFLTWHLHGSLPASRFPPAHKVSDVMANHVHLLLLPSISPSLLLKSLKGATAREANRLLNRTGEQFWQRESYDHWVRNDAEWSRIASYIERNPVKAGLVEKDEDYPWSSANPRWSKSVHTSVNAARKSACATKPSARATEPSACATAPTRILA